MDTHAVIRSQYRAALEMLKQTLAQCPAAVWDDRNDANRFGRIAYHALFYTHLYLEESEQAFVPWSGHRPGYQSIDNPPEADAAFNPAQALGYLVFCQQRVDERAPLLDLDGPSGFEWLPFSRLELQFYNIRHLHQHTGELMERLGSRTEAKLDWVGRVDADENR